MADYTMLSEAHKHSFCNAQEIQDSSLAGCFYCLEIIKSEDIDSEQFINEDDGQQTAWCPKCGIDALLGDASGLPIKTEFLSAMRDKFFDGAGCLLSGGRAAG